MRILAGSANYMFKVIKHNLFLCVYVTQALFTLNTKPHEAHCDWYDPICTHTNCQDFT